MPLPSASKLHYPYPKPLTPEDHAANLEQQKLWAERLPFLGVVGEYILVPPAALSTTATAYPNPMLGAWVDASYDPTRPYPYSDGAAGHGLLLPYQKQEDWTSIRVDITISGYTTTASRFWTWRLFVQPMTYWISGVSSQWPPSSREGGATGVQYLTDFWFNTINEHTQITDHMIIKPHPRGVWAAQPHWFTSGGAGTLFLTDEDRLRVVFTECIPALPRWAGDLP